MHFAIQEIVILSLIYICVRAYTMNSIFVGLRHITNTQMYKILSHELFREFLFRAFIEMSTETAGMYIFWNVR